MNTTSRFQSFVGKTVKSGVKSTGSMYPTLVATSTKDKFKLDRKAMAALGVDVEGYVNLIDVNLGGVETEDCNQRWFITAGYKGSDGQYKGAKIGNGGTFSYAGTYAAMLINDPAVTEATERDLVEAGKGRIYATKGEKQAFVATNKVAFRLERYTVTDENGEVQDMFEVAPGVIQPVFSLTHRTEIEHESEAGLDENQGSLPEGDNDNF